MHGQEEEELERRGYIHKDDLPDLLECTDAMTDVLDILYSTEEINLFKLTIALDFLACQLDCEMKIGNPKIERKL